jgi:hypothetical protein
MITFAYQVRDASGHIVSGIQDALNEDNAVTSLIVAAFVQIRDPSKTPAARRIDIDQRAFDIR